MMSISRRAPGGALPQEDVEEAVPSSMSPSHTYAAEQRRQLSLVSSPAARKRILWMLGVGLGVVGLYSLYLASFGMALDDA
jgi:hypothetical protein